MIGTTPVYLAKSYSVDSIGKAELLSRSVEIGVYNMMIDRTKDYSRYRSEGRNLRVYDNDIDNWSDIELAYAIENCGVWKDDGTLIDIFAIHAGRNAGHHAAADEEYDFLSFIDASGQTAKRRNIEHIGDMSTNFLKVILFCAVYIFSPQKQESNLENAGQTMLNALSYHDPKEARRLLNVFDKLRSTRSAGAAAYGDLDETTRDLVRDMGERIMNLVGEDHPLFESRRGVSPGEVFYRNFVLEGLELATDGGAATPIMSDAAQEERRVAVEQKWLRGTIGKPVPEAHHEKLDAIANQAKPVLERAQAIKQLLVKIQKETPDDVPVFPTSVHIDKWYKGRVDEFSSLYASEFGGASSSAAPIAAEAGSNVRYFPVGAPLPKGFRFVEKADTTPKPHLLKMPGFLAYVQGHQGGRVDPGARGLPGDRAARARRDQDVIDSGKTLTMGFLTVLGKRYANLIAHIQAVSKGSTAVLIQWLGKCFFLISEKG